MPKPTAVASRSASEAKITVAGTFPASRDAVEKIAAANASASPRIAKMNRTQAPMLSVRKSRENQLSVLACCGLNEVSINFSSLAPMLCLVRLLPVDPLRGRVGFEEIQNQCAKLRWKFLVW